MAIEVGRITQLTVPEFLKTKMDPVTKELVDWIEELSGRVLGLEQAIGRPKAAGETRQNHALRRALMRLRLVEAQLVHGYEAAFLKSHHEPQQKLDELQAAIQAVVDAVRQS